MDVLHFFVISLHQRMIVFHNPAGDLLIHIKISIKTSIRNPLRGLSAFIIRVFDLHQLQRPAENGREDELRPGLRAGIRVEPLEFDVLHLVQAEPVIIGMKFGFILRLAPALSWLSGGSLCRLAGLFDFSHRTYVFLVSFHGCKISYNSAMYQTERGDYP